MLVDAELLCSFKIVMRTLATVLRRGHATSLPGSLKSVVLPPTQDATLHHWVLGRTRSPEQHGEL